MAAPQPMTPPSPLGDPPGSGPPEDDPSAPPDELLPLPVKLDENILDLLEVLQDIGYYDTDTVVMEDLRGASDETVSSAAGRDNRILVTCDSDHMLPRFISARGVLYIWGKLKPNPESSPVTFVRLRKELRAMVVKELFRDYRNIIQQ
ncbi:hypothetical protein BC936DRAFT_146623 [Jimgerdemannia flammicorona]|uniref:DUF5615 domain-containing protein n=1 Tax=Jimgerdemannia flammicorona TaxID=994334 RepID=A0A433D760_9FUNG|nr:hypothetical protein BC936DRAFT_146623 [Jimgerdemannia flammicorona]